jgi:hypothetical protein
LPAFLESSGIDGFEDELVLVDARRCVTADWPDA